jgi:choline/glycine/proline betaine transport protein
LSLTEKKQSPYQPLSIFVILLLILFVAFAVFDVEQTGIIFLGLKDQVVSRFDVLFNWTVSLVLLLVIVTCFHPRAKLRLGKDEDRPEFSYLAWFSMLFSAGLASGILYWGTAEPITHMLGNPFLSMRGELPGSAEAAVTAVSVTAFHWGFHGWGLYVLVGLCIGLGAYRYDLPLTFGTAFAPLTGFKALPNGVSKAIDVIAVLGTVFGVATSIGLAVGGMNATLGALVNFEMSPTSQIAIVALVSCLGIFSAVTGVSKGIRFLSELNVWISVVLVIVIIIVGPTQWLLEVFVGSTLDYVANVIPMGFWTAESAVDKAWQSAWTVFYWGWWLAWAPFVGLFVARISKGRTIREFIIAVLFVPALIILLWMSVFGGTAVHQELQQAGSVSEIVVADYSQGIVTVFDNLGSEFLRQALVGTAAFLLFTWLITSLDSATLVLCHLLRVDHLQSMKVFWGFMLGAVTCVLILVGGISALQAASIIIGLPLAFLILLIAAGLIRYLVLPAPQLASTS